MFTGLIEAQGKIVSVTRLASGVRVRIETEGLPLEEVTVGDSISVNGVCLTVVAVDQSGFEMDVSEETLSCSYGLDRFSSVNLERSLLFGSKLGGHLVSGHVDATGSIVAIEPLNPTCLFRFQVPERLLPFIAAKGSIAVNGISLTVNEVDSEQFSVMIIPHTLKMTNLGLLEVGDLINIEVDMLARYVARVAPFILKGGLL
ncbi:MAG TPA: riboflavin synthase [Burkholderiales bacterium]|nr:riboflavin synthase [Burkholderiales bacterium]